MFSVITNIYNKKTKGPTLMELFTATRKLKRFFLTIKDVRCVHHGWHGTHWYDIQVLATHASTWVHQSPSLLHWSVPRATARSHDNGGTSWQWWDVLAHPTIATWPRLPKAMDHCSSEEYRCTHVDARVLQELEYRINVRRVIHGASIKHI
jgi:hypothetical protein